VTVAGGKDNMDAFYWLSVIFVCGAFLCGLVAMLRIFYLAFWLNRRAAYWEDQVKGLVRPAAKRGHGPLTGHEEK
jgi:hypothetical protein